MWQQKFFREYNDARCFERVMTYKEYLTDLFFVSGGYYVEFKRKQVM